MCLRLLLIDDESFVTREITAALDGQGFVIREEQDAGRALETIRGFRPDVVLLDFLMPKLHGGDVAWQIASDPALKGVRIILFSEIPAVELRPKMPPLQIVILEKPLDIKRLIGLLRE
ncbi:MAG: response regulator [Chthoniobacter sp.]